MGVIVIRECIGGPLDGERIEDDGAGAFAWPHGWYYARYRRVADGAWEIVYQWDGDAGTYIDTDHAKWKRGEHPRILSREAPQ